eukprot:c48315_g1_i1 orf=109-534(-)
MASELVDVREGAQVYTGHACAFEEAVNLLKSHNLPDGLLPLDVIEELGYVEQTGYFWVKQTKSKDHYFKGISRHVAYAKEVCGYLEGNSLRKLNGVKAKELMLWLPIVEISQRDSHPARLFFKTNPGLGKWYPREAFVLQN